MARRYTHTAPHIAALIFCAACAAAGTAWSSAPLDRPEVSAAVRIPFVPNQGQIADPDVLFTARTFGGAVHVMRDGTIVYSLPKYGPREPVDRQKTDTALKPIQGLAQLREELVGAKNLSPTGAEAAATVVSYFKGRESNQWQAGLPTFNAVDMGEVYDGIRLSLKAHGNNMEKVFTLAPQAEPNHIRIRVNGAQSLGVAPDGELQVSTLLGPVRFSAPQAWQTNAAGLRIPVQVAYVTEGSQFGFSLGDYDRNQSLMIDPLLASTFVGGGSEDGINAMILANNSNSIYVAGYTASIDFPVTNTPYNATWAGGYDVFVAQFDTDLTNLMASTFLGGSTNDVATCMALDINSNVFVGGYTESLDFPGRAATNPINGKDGFVCKLNATLTTLVASTNLNGSSNNAVFAMVLDTNGNAFVGGYTESTNFSGIKPDVGCFRTVLLGTRSGFVSKLTNTLSILMAGTYLGGNNSFDSIHAIAFDLMKTNLYVAGITWSTNFPCSTNTFRTDMYGAGDAFISRFNTFLTTTGYYGTYLGGSGEEAVNAIVVTADTNIFVAGYTYSANYPTNNRFGTSFTTNLSGASDGFLTRLVITPTNSYLAASTYLGGNGVDVISTLGVSLLIPATNATFPNAVRTNIVVAGYTVSENFPVRTDATYATLAGGEDGFAVVIGDTLVSTNVYRATFIGGSGNDRCNALVVNSGIDGHIALLAGYTESDNYPVTLLAVQPAFGGVRDGFISKLNGSLIYGVVKWNRFLNDLTDLEDVTGNSASMGWDGTIYVGNGSNLFAYNPNGTRKWAKKAHGRFNPPVSGTFEGLGSSLAIASNGTIYAGLDNGNVQALNAGGTSLWVFAANSTNIFYGSPAIGNNGNIYVASRGYFVGSINYATLYALSPAGECLWSNVFEDTTMEVRSSPTLDANGTVYLLVDSNTESTLHAFNPDDGSTFWSVTLAGDGYASPAIGTNGVIYVGCGSTFYGINPDGTTKFANSVGYQTYASPSIASNGWVYVAAGSSILAYDADGNFQWTAVASDTTISSSPAIAADGTIYVASGKKIFALKSNGDRFWTYQGNEDPLTTTITWQSPLIGMDGTIYMGDKYYLAAIYGSAEPDRTAWGTWGHDACRSRNPLTDTSPQSPSGLSVSKGTYTNYTSVLWNPTTYAQQYELWRSTNNSPDTAQRIRILAGTNYIDTSASVPGLVYYYWIKVQTPLGKSGYGHSDYGGVVCSRPTGVTASDNLYTNYIQISWSNSLRATGCEIWRHTADAPDQTIRIGTVGTDIQNYQDTNISINTPYYYFLKATNILGPSQFSDSDFGSISLYPPTNVVAGKGTATLAIPVSWPVASFASGYEVWRSLYDNVGGAEKITNVLGTNAWQDTSVIKGLTYYYWVRATNMMGISSFSSNDFGGTPPLPPDVVTAGQGASSNFIAVTWNEASYASAYILSRGTDTNPATATPLSTSLVSQVRSYNDYTVTPKQSYWYWVRSTNQYGISEFRANPTNGFRELAPPMTVSSVGFTNKIRVSWKVDPSVIGLGSDISYRIFRNTTPNPQSAIYISDIVYQGLTATNYDDLAITRGVGYYYWVQTKNAYGTSRVIQAGTVAGTPPTAPTRLMASDGDASLIHVSWDAVAIASSYEIWRGAASESSAASRLTSTTSTTYDDTTATPGVVYYYWVKALSSLGASDFSALDTGWRTLPPPLDVTASDGTYADNIRVTWTAASGATAYEVWRNTVDDTNTASMVANNIASTSYADTSAAGGPTYYYWILAKSGAFKSAFSLSNSGHRPLGTIDLAASDLIMMPTSFTPGNHPDAVSFRLANNGPADLAAPNANLMVNFFLSSNPVFGDADDTWIGNFSLVAPLTAGASTEILLTDTQRAAITMPALSGTYYVFVYVEHALPAVWIDPNLNNNSANRSGGAIRLGQTAPARIMMSDFTGDGKADLAVYQESTGQWYVRSMDGTVVLNGTVWGGPGLQPVAMDVDNDGKADMAVYQQAAGRWYARSVSGTILVWGAAWGGPGYAPLVGDYNGDRKADAAVYSQANGLWFIISTDGTIPAWNEPCGGPGFLPVTGDYNGDGRADLAVYRNGTPNWYVRALSGESIVWGAVCGGTEGFTPVSGDYDGDGRNDLALYHEASGYWFVMSVSGSQIAWGIPWGGLGMVAVPGDYDGDGISDFAIYHETTGQWYIRSSTGVTLLWNAVWGAPGFRPLGVYW